MGWIRNLISFYSKPLTSERIKKNYPSMHILDETDKYFIGHIYEDACVIEKRSGEEIFVDSFYGDPQCGLISRNNDWAIIAGEHIAIWKRGKTIKINLEEVKWVYAMRIAGDFTVEILIDPRSDKSAVWRLDMNTFELIKIRDFEDYKNKDFSEDVVW